MSIFQDYDDFFNLGSLPLLIRQTGFPIYDFNFRDFFPCHSVLKAPKAPVLLRIGAIEDFPALRESLRSVGISLLFTEEEHNRCSMLENWYPLIKEYTPYSRVYSQFPETQELLQSFQFPVFIKGSRQTNRHQRDQCIIQNIKMYEDLKKEWINDNILHWQKIAVREYIPLQKVDDTSYPDMIPFSYEFRVFLWKNKIAGIGKYWYLGRDYQLSNHEKEEISELAVTIAKIICVPFLAVDIAKTANGKWIVIEVNDGQESGYAGMNPFGIWQNILDEQ